MSIREMDLSFRKGQRVMPYERHSFLRLVRQMPSSLATAFSGRWKNCAQTQVRLVLSNIK